MRRASLIAFSILVGMSAASWRPFLPELPMSRRVMAKSLSALQWYVDAYGFASLSTPLFVKPDKTFNFRLENVTPNTFFDAARAEINVRNSGISSSAFGAGASLTGEFDILALQQGQSELASNRSDLATVAEKQRLLNEAAYQQYEAELLAAQSITDLSERGKKQAEAKRTLVANLAGPGANTPPKYLPPAASGGNAAAAVEGGLLSQLWPLKGHAATGSPAAAQAMRSSLLDAAGYTAT